MNACPLAADAAEKALAAGHAKELLETPHITSCADCTRSVARVAAFETSLRQAARSLSAGPVAALQVTGEDLHRSPPRRWLPVMAVTTAVVLVASVLISNASAIWRIEQAPAVQPGSNRPLERAAAARAMGVTEDEILMTTDGALALVHDGASLSLLLARQASVGIELVTLGTADLAAAMSGPSRHVTFAVVCPPAVGLSHSQYLFGYVANLAPPLNVSLVGLEAEAITTHAGGYLFVLDPGALNPETQWQIITGAGSSFGTGHFLDHLEATGQMTPAGCRIHA